ncbi:Rpgr [Symbiodinium sp. KB8]|nr:Rpgr [Symbiodinium sp. KB8]
MALETSWAVSWVMISRLPQRFDVGSSPSPPSSTTLLHFTAVAVVIGIIVVIIAVRENRTSSGSWDFERLGSEAPWPLTWEKDPETAKPSPSIASISPAALLGADVAPLEDELGKDGAPVTSAGCAGGAKLERLAGNMALRLLADSNHYVTPQDVYNLLLLGHHVRRTDWAKHVLPFLGWRPLRAIAVATRHRATYAISEAGQPVCFGANGDALPPDLGPVVAVAAGAWYTCAVKASGELVCFGDDDDGQCDAPPGFKVRLAPQSIATPTPDPAREVLQPVYHSEPAADISQEESAAIVAEQEASWIEHNIGSGWHCDELQPRIPAGLTRVVHLTLSRSHRQLHADLAESPVLQPCRQALEAEGFGWQLEPSGAKIFMEPVCFRAVRSHLSTMRLRPCDIFVAENLEEEVMRVICSLPYTALAPSREAPGASPLRTKMGKWSWSDFLNSPSSAQQRNRTWAEGSMAKLALLSKAGELRGPMELLRLHNPHGGLRLRVFGRDLYHLCWLCAHRHRRGQTLPYNVAGTVLRFLTVLYECGSECQSRVAATSRRTYAIDSNRELVRFGVAGDDGVPSGLVGPLSCIAVGLSHVCLLKESGELLCHSPYGATVPPNLDLGPAVAVTAGFYHTCVLKASGELVCFGSHGPSCNVPPGLGRVIAVAAGQHHTCAVRANGELVCFGGNQRGQCDVPADLGPVSSVAAGLSFTCAVTAHGELVCFGSNSHGQCDVPPDLGPVSAVAAGYVHTCAVKSTGQLVCFGGNDYGQCDVPADLDPVVAVAAGPHHTCAVTDRGMLVCFGDNQFRQCEIPASIRLRV